MEFIYITNNPIRAVIAQDSGVDRIMVDLEYLGKHERQSGRNTRISRHSLVDIPKIRSLLQASKLMVRVNPMHDGLAPEVEAVLGSGADILMLPMARRVDEVERFVEMVRGRSAVSLLLETASALGRVRQMCMVGGLNELHIGLNDLHAELGLEFMFEVITGGLIEFLSCEASAQQLTFGFGGIAKLDSSVASVKAELLIAAHVLLNSRVVILSRDFDCIFDTGERNREALIFAEQIAALRAKFDITSQLSREDLLLLMDSFTVSVQEVANALPRQSRKI
jgi:HpcH/HpaI aldolase/citrate lyase family